MQPTTSFFSWSLCHNSTLTFVWIQWLGVHMASACLLCLRYEETESHLFFNCQFVVQAWRWLLTNDWASQSLLSPSSIWCFLSSNVKEVRIVGVIMFTMLHSIWKARNILLHCNSQLNLSSICDFFNAEVAFYLQKLSNLLIVLSKKRSCLS